MTDLFPEYGTREHVLMRAKHYHRQHDGWNNLHVVVDDGNMEDFNLGCTVGWCDAKGDVTGAYIAGFLWGLSEDERADLVSEMETAAWMDRHDS